MMRLAFVDPTCARPYTRDTLRQTGLGGAEATMVRIASTIADRFRVTVAQRARTDRLVEDGVLYVPFDPERGPFDPERGLGIADADVVVVMRSAKLLPRLRRELPGAKLFLWLHEFPSHKLEGLGQLAAATDTTIVTVSHHHRQAIDAFIRDRAPAVAPVVQLSTVYSPIDDDLYPEGRLRDPDKLLFLSSPHKGLDQVVRTFSLVRKQLPSLRLCVANPGNVRWKVQGLDSAGIEVLGELSHPAVIQQLRESLCLFYPQSSFAETFGLVFAEANAVGTPVMTHRLGAAPEVLDHCPEQLVNADDPEEVKARLIRWRQFGVPPVGPVRAFRLSQVAERWCELLGSAKDLALGA